MRKLTELDADEFLDLVYALSPIIPVIAEMDVIKAHVLDVYSEEIQSAQSKIRVNKLLLEKATGEAKRQEYQQNIDNAIKTIQSSNALTFAKEMGKLIPFLSSRDNRNCMYEVVSIIEKESIVEVKKYPAPKLLTKIKQIITDADFKSFLSYSEQSESTD